MHYRRKLLQERISAIDRKANFNWDLLDTLLQLKSAWNQVKPETIKNCFRKANFITLEQASKFFKYI